MASQVTVPLLVPLLEVLCDAIMPYSLPFIFAGDLQFQPWEVRVTSILARALFRELDDCREGIVPCTGPGKASTYDTTADHAGVGMILRAFVTLLPLNASDGFLCCTLRPNRFLMPFTMKHSM